MYLTVLYSYTDLLMCFVTSLVYIVFTLTISSNVQQEGLVEIREDCIEETSNGESAASGKFSFDLNCYIGIFIMYMYMLSEKLWDLISIPSSSFITKMTMAPKCHCFLEYSVLLLLKYKLCFFICIWVVLEEQ